MSKIKIEKEKKNKSEEDYIPPNFEYEEDIVDYAENTFALIDSFEAFMSHKDEKPYIIYQNKNTQHLEVLKVLKNKYKLVTKIEGHNSNITCIKYFYNEQKNTEYLISADYIGKIIITNITDNYKQESALKMEYDNGKISCCLMLFKFNFSFFKANTSIGIKNPLILIANKNTSIGEQLNPIKEYFLENNGNLVLNDDLYLTSPNTSYIIHWFHKTLETDYIIDIGYKKINIIVLFGEYKGNIYASFKPSMELETWYHCGLVYNDEEQNRELLFITSIKSYVFVFDLYSRQLIKEIKTSGKMDRLYNIIKWNINYILVSNATTPDIKVININQKKCVGNNYIPHEDDFRCIRKIKHPKFGYCIITGGDDNSLKLFKPRGI